MNRAEMRRQAREQEKTQLPKRSVQPANTEKQAREKAAVTT